MLSGTCGKRTLAASCKSSNPPTRWSGRKSDSRAPSSVIVAICVVPNFDTLYSFGLESAVSKTAIAFVIALLLCSDRSLAAQAQSAITEQEAHAVGVDAYIYFYPLVTMDVTRKQLTNVEPGKGVGAPMNVLFNVPTFPTADMKQVVRPNR
jgi:hypothetical protein